MPYCYMLGCVISGDVHGVKGGSVPSNYIISDDVHGVAGASVLSSFNTGSDHRLINIDFDGVFLNFWKPVFTVILARTNFGLDLRPVDGNGF
uniref:Uncharacterized protein n=1 Tax=Plectus sambesii TaxID=2011161 RepID=A0A914WKD7_9BILA